MMPWVAWDKTTRRVHVQFALAKTEKEARYELAMLLKPYSADHNWRKRLELKWSNKRGKKDGPPKEDSTREWDVNGSSPCATDGSIREPGNEGQPQAEAASSLSVEEGSMEETSNGFAAE